MSIFSGIFRSNHFRDPKIIMNLGTFFRETNESEILLILYCTHLQTQEKNFFMILFDKMRR